MKKCYPKNSHILFKEYLSFDDVLIKPHFSGITLKEIDLSTNVLGKFDLKIPIIASSMDTVCGWEMAVALGKLGGLGIIHRNQSIESQANEVKKVLKKEVIVGAAVGLSNDFENRVKALTKTGANIICLDYSIGHSKCAIEAAKHIRNKYHCEVISGNITTREAIRDYLKNNIRIFRYGISNSPICISQQISGVGVPLFSALLDIKFFSLKENIFLIADGGIRTSGDIVKALAAGAHAVMLGSMLAGTKESPGKMINIKGKLYKQYRGMGSLSAIQKGSGDRYNQLDFNSIHPEGTETFLEYKGAVKNVIDDIVYGIKSAMLKIGAKNLSELKHNAEFIKIKR